MQLFRDFSFLYYYGNTILLVSLFFFHWFFDFVCQISGDKKYGDNKILLYHTTFYSIWMTLVYTFLCHFLHIEMNYYFFPITWICHTTTDYITSRINHKTYVKYGPGKELVDRIGFDQWLHHAQLFLTI
jgi:hypothetical protein